MLKATCYLQMPASWFVTRTEISGRLFSATEEASTFLADFTAGIWDSSVSEFAPHILLSFSSWSSILFHLLYWAWCPPCLQLLFGKPNKTKSQNHHNQQQQKPTKSIKQTSKQKPHIILQQPKALVWFCAFPLHLPTSAHPLQFCLYLVLSLPYSCP